ncbi:hypothetical protein [Nonomuraea longicatena]|uniref:Polyadenylate-specific 3'-exoribonuclease AS n=1 Tax=Nonomuraea longicatena TaxID=83682 RepID=A0ABN1NWS3_9ACTN
MRIFYDTEFLDTGATIELISIGLVADDGREYYAVNVDAPWQKIAKHDWLMENVVQHLPLVDGIRRGPLGGLPQFRIDRANVTVKPQWVIANEVREFILSTPEPELWAYYAAYDHVVLAQLWGPMVNLPTGVPMFTCDLKQEHVRLGRPPLPSQDGGEHHALADARHNRTMAALLDSLARPVELLEPVELDPEGADA